MERGKASEKWEKEGEGRIDAEDDARTTSLFPLLKDRINTGSRAGVRGSHRALVAGALYTGRLSFSDGPSLYLAGRAGLGLQSKNEPAGKTRQL